MNSRILLACLIVVVITAVPLGSFLSKKFPLQPLSMTQVERYATDGSKCFSGVRMEVHYQYTPISFQKGILPLKISIINNDYREIPANAKLNISLPDQSKPLLFLDYVDYTRRVTYPEQKWSKNIDIVMNGTANFGKLQKEIIVELSWGDCTIRQHHQVVTQHFIKDLQDIIICGKDSYNVLIIGPMGVGKSKGTNSCLSCVGNTIRTDAATGKAEGTFTDKLSGYNMMYAWIRLTIWDLFGITQDGFSLENFMDLLGGRIREATYNRTTEKYNYVLENDIDVVNERKIDVVLFVLNAQIVLAANENVYRQYIQHLIGNASIAGYQTTIVVTGLNSVADEEVKGYVDKMEDLFKVDGRIYPLGYTFNQGYEKVFEVDQEACALLETVLHFASSRMSCSKFPVEFIVSVGVALVVIVVAYYWRLFSSRISTDEKPDGKTQIEADDSQDLSDEDVAVADQIKSSSPSDSTLQAPNYHFFLLNNEQANSTMVTQE